MSKNSSLIDYFVSQEYYKRIQTKSQTNYEDNQIAAHTPDHI